MKVEHATAEPVRLAHRDPRDIAVAEPPHLDPAPEPPADQTHRLIVETQRQGHGLIIADAPPAHRHLARVGSSRLVPRRGSWAAIEAKSGQRANGSGGVMEDAANAPHKRQHP